MARPERFELPAF